MTSLTDVHQKQEVRSFWEATPCGAKHASSLPGTRAFFEEVESSRNELEPFISEFARFEDAAGEDVLEIGTGL